MSAPTTWTEKSFTDHVGAGSFQEAVDVIMRTKVQDETKIEEMYNRIKSFDGVLKAARELYSSGAIMSEPEPTENDHFRFIVARHEMKQSLLEFDRK